MTDETEAKPAETLPVEIQPRRRGRRKEVLDTIQEPQPDDPKRAKAAETWLVKRSGKTGPDDLQIKVSIVTITPAIASDLLALARQRSQAVRYSKTAVATYAEAIRTGRWILNGMPIAFSETQRILDGFQRLKAVIEADTPITTFLVQNLPDSSEIVVDQQHKRSYAGVLQSQGIKNAGTIVAALAKLIRIDQGALRASGSQPVMSWATLDRYFRPNYGQLRQAVDFALKAVYASTTLGDSARVPLAYMAARMGKIDRLEQMLSDFYDPDRAGRQAPGRKLQRRLRDLYRDTARVGGRPDPLMPLALAIQAFDETLTGVEPDEGYAYDPDTQPFPTPAGYPGLWAPIESVGAVDVRPEPLNPAIPRGVTMSYEVVNAATARDWLQRNGRNRNLQKGHISSLARDIVHGDWRLSPHPICWGRDDNGAEILVNGQHRLNAVIEASLVDPNASIEVFVVRGLDAKAAFATYDMQPRRALAIGGAEILDKELVLSIANLYHRFRLAPELAKEWAKKHPDLAAKRPGKLTAWQKPTASELERLITSDDPGKMLRDARFHARALKHLGQPAVMGYTTLRLLQVGPKEEAERFIGQLTGAEGVQAGSAVKSLKKRLAELKPERNPDGGPTRKAVHYNRFLAMYAIFETYEREVLRHRKPEQYVIEELVEYAERQARKRERDGQQLALPGVEATVAALPERRRDEDDAERRSDGPVEGKRRGRPPKAAGEKAATMKKAMTPRSRKATTDQSA